MKRKLYLIAAARSRRIVGWWHDQSVRDTVIDLLNRNADGQYIRGSASFGDGEDPEFDPADLVCPECYVEDLRRTLNGGNVKW